MKSRPNLALIVLIVLPILVLVAGIVTMMVAGDQGFTPIPGAERIIGSH